MRKFFLALVQFYRKNISPFLGNQCRFEPTCSHYFEQAVEKKNPAQAFWLGAKRILKCHPFHSGGFDPLD
jgi:putative membrane protein insertion efficiency factor